MAVSIKDNATVNGNAIYHAGNKPTSEELGVLGILGDCSNTDFNNIKECGRYSGRTGMVNAARPEGVCTLDVDKYNDDWIVQTQTTMWEDGQFGIYRRVFHNATAWSPWRELYHEGAKPSATDIGAAPTVHNHDSIYIKPDSNEIYKDINVGSDTTSKRIYLRLFVMNTTDAQAICSLYGTGDFGHQSRGNYQITVSTRNRGFGYRILAFCEARNHPTEFYRREVDGRYEVWAKFAVYNLYHRLDTHTRARAEFTCDGRTTTEPSNLTRLNVEQVYTTGNRPQAHEIGSIGWREVRPAMSELISNTYRYPYSLNCHFTDGEYNQMALGTTGVQNAHYPWWFIEYFPHVDYSIGYGHQRITNMHTGQIFTRSSHGTAWGQWSEIYQSNQDVKGIMHTSSITVNGDGNKFYPVSVSKLTTGISTYEIYREIHLDGNWKGHMRARFESRYNGWGAYGPYMRLTNYHRSETEFIGSYSCDNGPRITDIIWLKGGGLTYNFTANYKIHPVVYYDRTNVGNASNPEWVEARTTVNTSIVHDGWTQEGTKFIGNVETIHNDSNFIAPNNYGYCGRDTGGAMRYMLYMRTDNRISLSHEGRQVEVAGIMTANNNASYTTKQVRNTTLSSNNPSGGSNGDIWIKFK